MKQLALLLAALALTAALHSQADVLELRNGTVLNGKYVGGTAATIRFENAAGVQVIETSQVIALTFTTTGAPAESAPAPAPPSVSAATPTSSPAAVVEPQSVTLPAGTTLLVRMMDSISSQSKPGAKFTTKLEYDLAAGGASVVKGGTVIYGRVQSSSQAGRAVGRSTLDLRLAEMVINGQPVPIMTSGYKESGKASVGQAAKGAAAGAAIGGIAGNAKKGAAIGATTGALVKGETVTVTPGTLLEFSLTQPVTVRP